MNFWKKRMVYYLEIKLVVCLNKLKNNYANLMAKKKTEKIKKKKITEADKESKSLFCTECNETLDDFCFDDEAMNKNAVKKKHLQCVKSGKFNGEFCSKIFISSDLLPDGIFDEKE